MIEDKIDRIMKWSYSQMGGGGLQNLKKVLGLQKNLNFFFKNGVIKLHQIIETFPADLRKQSLWAFSGCWGLPGNHNIAEPFYIKAIGRGTGDWNTKTALGKVPSRETSSPISQPPSPQPTAAWKNTWKSGIAAMVQCHFQQIPKHAECAALGGDASAGCLLEAYCHLPCPFFLHWLPVFGWEYVPPPPPAVISPTGDALLGTGSAATTRNSLTTWLIPALCNSTRPAKLGHCTAWPTANQHSVWTEFFHSETVRGEKEGKQKTFRQTKISCLLRGKERRKQVK